MSYLPGALGQAIFSAAAAAPVAPRRGTVTGPGAWNVLGDFNRSNQAFSATGGAWSNSAPQRQAGVQREARRAEARARREAEAPQRQAAHESKLAAREAKPAASAPEPSARREQQAATQKDVPKKASVGPQRRPCARQEDPRRRLVLHPRVRLQPRGHQR